MATTETYQQLRERHRAEEAAYVREVLEACGWSPTRTGEALGLSASTVQTTLRRLGLEEEARAKAPRPGWPAGRSRKSS